jgi:hypothetical protein
MVAGPGKGFGIDRATRGTGRGRDRASPAPVQKCVPIARERCEGPTRSGSTTSGFTCTSSKLFGLETSFSKRQFLTAT